MFTIDKRKCEPEKAGAVWTTEPIPQISIMLGEEEGKAKFSFTIMKKETPILSMTISPLSDVEPDCVIGGTTVFVGFDFYVLLYNLRGELISSVDLDTVFFKFLLSQDVVICICEADVIFLDTYGRLLKHKSLDDIITNAYITQNGQLYLDCYEGDNLTLNLPTV